MKYVDQDVFYIAECYNRVAKDAKTPVKIMVSSFEKGKAKAIRYNISLAHWDNTVIQSLNDITSSEAVAYIQGFGHLANCIYNHRRI